jgi:hypothetical protein
VRPQHRVQINRALVIFPVNPDSGGPSGPEVPGEVRCEPQPAEWLALHRREPGVRIVNEHARRLKVPKAAVSDLVESLGSEKDRLWPRDTWPPMRLQGGLAPRSSGGHGPIRYFVELHEPGRLVRFRFSRPRGWKGTHEFRVDVEPDGYVRLSHRLDVRADLGGALRWFLILQPLHDALMQDLMAGSAVALESGPAPMPVWSFRVRVLRGILGIRWRRLFGGPPG